MIIIFTDLDGTLLDEDTYSYKKALSALNVIKKEKIPLIICTSKTRAEIEYYRKRLENKHPFIMENGGAIFIPKNYFNFEFRFDKQIRNYYVIELGKEYKILRNVIGRIKAEGIEIDGFGDMSLKELAKDSGLSLEEAKLSKKREYDEPFKINRKDEKKVIMIIKRNKLGCIKGGRYWHLVGKNDKGKAVKILTKLFLREYKIVETIGIGDSKNDFEMLENVNQGYLVQKKNRRYSSSKFKKAKGIGPEGWNKVVLDLVKDLNK